MIKHSPCKGCQDRQENCHANCGPYLEYEAARQAERDAIRREKQARQMIDDYVIKAKSKNTKGKNVKRGKKVVEDD